MNDVAKDQIKAFFIFEINTGNTYYSKIFSPDFTADPLLTTAFLTAMYKFARDARLSELKVINLSELSLLFIENNGIMFAVLTSNFISPIDVESKLRVLTTLFLSEYDHILSEKVNFIQTNIFEDFEEIVDEVILGYSRILPKDIRKELEKILNENKNIVKGAAILGYSGQPIINLMDESLLNAAVKYVNITFSQEIYDMKYNIIITESANLMLYTLGEGLVLIIATGSSVTGSELIMRMNQLRRKIHSILPH